MPADRTAATSQLILLRHGESEWNAKNLFTGWVDVDLSDAGERGAAARRRAARRRRLAPEIVHTSLLRRAITDRQHRPRRRRPDLAAGEAQLAPQRTPLRRVAGQEQGADPRAATAKSSSCSGAARTTCRRRRTRGRRRVLPGRRPPLRDAAAGVAAAHRVPQGRRRPDAAVLVRVDRARPASRSRRCSSPRTATHCARWSSTSTRSPTTRSPS